jgi:endonuclease/exonuclease/phosphatase family metal-dependent hydrolase
MLSRNVHTKFSLRVYSLVFLWVLAAIISLQVPPEFFWPTAFIALTLPGGLILNLVFLVIWALRKSWKTFLPLALMVFTWEYHTRGVALNFPQVTAAPAATPGQIRVLSYNVRIFNTYAHLQDKNQTSSKEMIRWVAQHPADVFCLQEFYNERDSPVFNSISKIGRNHGRHIFVSRTLVNHIGAEFGMAIFSRYPLIHKGTIQFGKLTQNHAMFADLKIHRDTIRVYNFHLQSMSIEEQEIVDTYSDQDNLKKKGTNLLRRFKRGFVKRGDQVTLLLDHVKTSPYPVILCGDLNDLPYSYTYQSLSQDFKNAFQEKGLGFGATYNGRIPFVRIDNQFCSPSLEVVNFTLHNTVRYSDHFPITATYQLPESGE